MVTERDGIHNTNDLSLINKWIFDRSAWQWIFKAIFQPFSTPALLVHLQSGFSQYGLFYELLLTVIIVTMLPRSITINQVKLPLSQLDYIICTRDNVCWGKKWKDLCVTTCTATQPCAVRCSQIHLTIHPTCKHVQLKGQNCQLSATDFSLEFWKLVWQKTSDIKKVFLVSSRDCHHDNWANSWKPRDLRELTLFIKACSPDKKWTFNLKTTAFFLIGQSDHCNIAETEKQHGSNFLAASCKAIQRHHWLCYSRLKVIQRFDSVRKASQTQMSAHTVTEVWDWLTASAWCNITSVNFNTRRPARIWLSFRKSTKAYPRPTTDVVAKELVMQLQSFASVAEMSSAEYSSNICTWQTADGWNHPKETFHTENKVMSRLLKTF